ncbi:MAG: radical SAM protein [Candidatus Diapherotrites archaeon]
MFKKKGKIIKNKERELIRDLDSVPFPARHLLKNPNAYVPSNGLRLPVASIMTSRGCHGGCTYCCSKLLFGRSIRFRSVENVIAEIEQCIKDFGVKEIHVQDDVFTADKKRTLEFAREIKKRNLGLAFVFNNGLRADQVTRKYARH